MPRKKVIETTKVVKKETKKEMRPFSDYLLNKRKQDNKIGFNEYVKFVKNKKITEKEAILAMCYYCNFGYNDGIEDCLITNCPLYPFMPYKGITLSKEIKEEE